MGKVITVQELLDLGYQPIDLDKAVLNEISAIGIDYQEPFFMLKTKEAMVSQCLTENLWTKVGDFYFTSKDVRKAMGKSLPWEV